MPTPEPVDPGFGPSGTGLAEVLPRTTEPGEQGLSEIAPTTTNAPTAARVAIAKAARATGVDFDYLLAQAKLESGLDPAARSSSSSATGLYQFLGGTWLDTLKKHGAAHGLGWAAQAAGDPGLRGQVMALRNDPQISALMAAELAGDNKAALTASLRREPDAAELYLAHFLGQQGANQFLAALEADPGQSAASVLPAAAATNRAIFFAPGGAPRSLGAVMDLLRGRMGRAMEGGDGAQWADLPLPAGSLAATGQTVFAGGPVARAFRAAQASSAPAAPSMAETLRQTFNVGGEGGAALPEHVSYAYRRLSALGL